MPNACGGLSGENRKGQRERERDFITAAPAGRLRLVGGCLLRRRWGGGLDARAGNPSAGSGRGMLWRAVAFPGEGDASWGGGLGEQSRAAWSGMARSQALLRFNREPWQAGRQGNQTRDARHRGPRLPRCDARPGPPSDARTRGYDPFVSVAVQCVHGTGGGVGGVFDLARIFLSEVGEGQGAGCPRHAARAGACIFRPHWPARDRCLYTAQVGALTGTR